MNPKLKIKGIFLIALFLSIFTLSQAYGYVYDGRHWFLANPMGEPYLINPNCADSAAGTPDEQIAAIKDGGARAWMNEGNANFTFTYGGTTPKTLPDDGTVGFYNGYNEIMFVQDPEYWHFKNNPSVIASTFVWYYSSTKEIFECDMAFSDVNFTFNGVGQPTSQEMDIWDIATHELGHFLRLGHSSYTDATMYAYTSKGETKSRDLHPDDIAGIQFIYGAAANTNPVLSSGYVTPLNGYPSTNFSFFVNYYDADGDVPAIANVYISGTPYAMSLYSGTAANGTYSCQTTLPIGTYNYFFEFVDARGGSDKEPVLWPKDGPTVTFKCGDANGDNQVNVGDVIYLINYLFKGGPAPVNTDAADVNNDGNVNVTDVIYLINYLFKGGPAPRCL